MEYETCHVHWSEVTRVLGAANEWNETRQRGEIRDRGTRDCWNVEKLEQDDGSAQGNSGSTGKIGLPCSKR